MTTEETRESFILCFLWRSSGDLEVCKACSYRDKANCRKKLYSDILEVFNKLEAAEAQLKELKGEE